ncbi:MAG: NAD(P)-dependent oxidoreductase [Dehalococcoidia bacterium]
MRALILAPFSDRGLDRLRRLGDVTYESWLDTNRLQDPAELGARLAADRIDVLIVEADFLFEEVFAAGTLRLAGVCRNALNHVDLPAAKKHRVAVTHAPGRNTNAVAEMTLGLMIALARRIPQAHAMVAAGEWRDPTAGYRRFRGREITGATVGVVGFGRIGREVARKCLALGARVLAHDPLVPERHMLALGVRPATLPQLARAADFVTLHVSPAQSTRRMVDAAFLTRMKPGAMLVNTSAGDVVDPAALVEALELGRLAGAALDVFEGHPLPASSPLRVAPNLILTPHIAGATGETVDRQSRMMVGEVERLLAGRPLRHAVNPAEAAPGP